MKPEHASPDDPLDNASDSLDSQRLADIERQLRQARPVAPQLDPAAIERLARETAAPAEAWPCGEESRVVLKRPPQDATERGRRIRSCAAFASSWVCGAIVGAVAMFVYVGKPSLPLDSGQGPTNAAHTAAEHVSNPAVEVPQPPRSPLSVAAYYGQTDTPDIAWLIAADMLGAHQHRDPYCRRDSSTWRAGLSLPRIATAYRREVGAMQDADPASLPQAPASEYVTPPAPQRDLEPTVPMTREQLLRELMSSISGPML